MGRDVRQVDLAQNEVGEPEGVDVVRKSARPPRRKSLARLELAARRASRVRPWPTQDGLHSARGDDARKCPDMGS